jgi:hypothetical protein
MAVITSYSSLLTAGSDWLARGDLSTFMPNFVQNWEEKFFREPKNFGRWMEVSLSSAIASSVLAVPSAYLGLKHAYVNGSPSSRLDRVSLNQLYGRYPRGSSTGLPVWMSRDTTNFVFGPAPDSTYTIKGVYWAKPTVMRSYTTGGADAIAHWIIVNAPDLALYGALCESAPFLRADSRLPVWKSLYQEALQDYRQLNKEEDVSGSPIQEVLA